MSSLRHRTPFVDEDEGVLLDDEQENVIESLRARNEQSTARALLVVDGVLALSALLHVAYMQQLLFGLLALALHVNLALLLHPLGPIRAPLSYTVSYAVAGVSPMLSLFLGRSWPEVLWAAAPALVVFLTHSVHSTLQDGDAALAELETLKYRAPGP